MSDRTVTRRRVALLSAVLVTIGLVSAPASSRAATPLRTSSPTSMTSPTGNVLAVPQTVSRFDATSGGTPSGSGLILGRNGSIYGLATQQSGGFLYRISPAGVRTTIGTFPCNPDGQQDCIYGELFAGGLVQGSDGSFYFYVDYESSNSPDSDGAIYRMSPTGKLTALYYFPDYYKLPGDLVFGPDGALYGLTSYIFDAGTAFRLATDGSTFATIASFDTNSGQQPGGLTLGPDGNFYGLTDKGGTAGLGTFFRMTPAGAVTDLASLDGSNGQYGGYVTLGSDGNFYASSWETITRFDASGAYQVLNTFDARFPGKLLQAGDGNLYGISQGNDVGGEGGHGSLFAISHSGSVTEIATFDRGAGFDPNGDGAYVVDNNLVQGADGAIYGTTSSYGTGPFGTVWRLPLPGLVANAVAGNHQITLTWTSVAGANSYHVYESSTPGGEGSVAFRTVTGTTLVLDDVPNATYYFQIAAVTASGEGPRSAEVSVLVNTPDPFSFVDVTNAPLGTQIKSNQVTITGLVAPAPISVQNGTYSINQKAFTKAPGVIRPGDRLRLRRISSDFPNRTQTVTVTIDVVSVTWSVRTGP